jgi:dienelactone hydrolase
MTAKRIRQTMRERTAIPGGTRLSLELRAEELGDAAVPAILLLPDVAREVPAALLLHGYTSHKEMMSDRVGRALLDGGVASLAVDLPMHGERSTAGERSAIQPLELMRNWKLALAECTIALRYLAARPEIDRDRLGIVGYSLGSFLGVTVAARERAVRAIVLAAGGDLPAEMPFGMMVRAVIDPAAAVRKLEGTPLLMVHGRRDRTVTPEQARRLFEAAREPKEIRWWDAGHYLPDAVIGEAAGWLAEQLGVVGRRRTG